MKEKERGEAADLYAGNVSVGTHASPHPLLRGARAALFDAGGTLSHPDWERIALLAKRETGREFTAEVMRRTLYESLRAADARLGEEAFRKVHTRRPGWVFCDMFSSLGVDEDACERLRGQLVAAHSKKHVWCILDAEVPHVISRLKQAGLRVGVISNTEDGRLKELLEMIEIATHFDLLIDSFVVGLRKPDAAIFHHALEQLEIAPRDAVYVGDSYGHDVQGAKRAGLRAILLDPLDIYAESDCARIHSLGELVNYSLTAGSH